MAVGPITASTHVTAVAMVAEVITPTARQGATRRRIAREGVQLVTRTTRHRHRHLLHRQEEAILNHALSPLCLRLRNHVVFLAEVRGGSVQSGDSKPQP